MNADDLEAGDVMSAARETQSMYGIERCFERDIAEAVFGHLCSRGAVDRRIVNVYREDGEFLLDSYLKHSVPWARGSRMPFSLADLLAPSQLPSRVWTEDDRAWVRRNQGRHGVQASSVVYSVGEHGCWR